DIRWGDVSQVECELLLFRTASRKGPYAYYHLLSGVDMPLKTQDEIHSFFEKEQGKLFIGFDPHVSRAEVDRKVQRYHLFPRHFRHGEGLPGLLRRGIRFLALRLQLALQIRRHRHVDFRKGLSWVSITDDFLAFVLLHKDSVL